MILSAICVRESAAKSSLRGAQPRRVRSRVGLRRQGGEPKWVQRCNFFRIALAANRPAVGAGRASPPSAAAAICTGLSYQTLRHSRADCTPPIPAYFPVISLLFFAQLAILRGFLALGPVIFPVKTGTGAYVVDATCIAAGRTEINSTPIARPSLRYPAPRCGHRHGIVPN